MSSTHYMIVQSGSLSQVVNILSRVFHDNTLKVYAWTTNNPDKSCYKIVGLDDMQLVRLQNSLAHATTVKLVSVDCDETAHTAVYQVGDRVTRLNDDSDMVVGSVRMIGGLSLAYVQWDDDEQGQKWHCYAYDVLWRMEQAVYQQEETGGHGPSSMGTFPEDSKFWYPRS